MDGSGRGGGWIKSGWRTLSSGAAGGKSAASGGVCAANRHTVVDLSVRRNCFIRAVKLLYPYAGIALFVRRNCCIRASILLYRCGERGLAGRSFGEEGYVDPACIRIARGEQLLQVGAALVIDRLLLVGIGVIKQVSERNAAPVHRLKTE